MKIYSCMLSVGLTYDRNNPPAGLLPVSVAGNTFFDRIYAADGRDTGSRDYTRFSAAEMKVWVKGAKPGSAIIPNIENVHICDGVTRTVRELHTDIRLSSGPDITKDMRYLEAAVDACLEAGVDPDELGIYGLCPTGFDVQNRLILKRDMRIARAANDFLFSHEPFRSKIRRRLHPSMYPSTNIPNVWAEILAFQKSECDRLGRDCVPFLSPVYHPSSRVSFGTGVSLDYWQFMLDKCEWAGCPAVVIWQGEPKLDVRMYIEAAQEWLKKRAPKSDTLNVNDQKPIGRK